MRSRARLAAAALLGSGVVLYLLAAALTEACTTDERCTLQRCASRCDSPERVLLVGWATLLVVGVIFVLSTRFRRRAYLMASGAISIATAVVMLALVRT